MYADTLKKAPISLELDGMKSPDESESAKEDKTETPTDESEESTDGEMAIEAMKKGDGAAFEEAIKRIVERK